MATSIKFPEDLKKRVARVVKDTEQSAHAFMVDAIRQETDTRWRRPRRTTVRSCRAGYLERGAT